MSSTLLATGKVNPNGKPHHSMAVKRRESSGDDSPTYFPCQGERSEPQPEQYKASTLLVYRAGRSQRPRKDSPSSSGSTEVNRHALKTLPYAVYPKSTPGQPTASTLPAATDRSQNPRKTSSSGSKEVRRRRQRPSSSRKYR